MSASPLPQAAVSGLRQIALVLITLAVLTESSWGSNFSVSPVQVHLTANRNIAALRVYNAGARAVSIQAQPLLWTQQSGQDLLTPTEELLATPPIFTVPPGATQIVRVGLRTAPDKVSERTFRLYLTELPSPESNEFNGLQMATRISLPVFVAPLRGEVAFKLAWNARLTEFGQLSITGVNEGTGHAKATQLKATFQNGSSYQENGIFYVLPNSSKVWTIPAASVPANAGSMIELVVEIDGVPKKALVRLD